MKTLQRRLQVLYRFRCERCRSKFEMTEEEKLENDWKYDTGDKSNPYHTEPINPTDKFYCPVCEKDRIVTREDMHKYSVMDDGTEIMDY